MFFTGKTLKFNHKNHLTNMIAKY